MSYIRKTLVDLMRHGEPVGGRRYRGQIDDPLSEKGWLEMRTAVGDHCPWDRIVSSPLQRCIAFAQELSTRHGLPLTADARLKEIGFGAWEGRTAEELEAEEPGRLQRFWSDPERHTPPRAEPIGTFYDRVTSVWQQLLSDHAGEHLLLVAHAGVIRMVISYTLGTPLKHAFRLQVPSAGITRVRVDQNGTDVLPKILFHGRRHLQ